MKHTDKTVKEALEVLEFKYVGRDEDGEINAYDEWPYWDDEEEQFYTAGRSFKLHQSQFQALCKGYSQPLAAFEFDEEGKAYEI